MKYLSALLSHLFCIAPNVKIWNLTVDANNDNADVSWKHNFSVDSSKFVVEFTLDSKSQINLPRAYKGNARFYWACWRPKVILSLRLIGPRFIANLQNITLQGAQVYSEGRYCKCYEDCATFMISPCCASL